MSVLNIKILKNFIVIIIIIFFFCMGLTNVLVFNAFTKKLGNSCVLGGG